MLYFKTTSVYDKNPQAETTYCTTCDDTNPPSNCTPREKPRAVVNPGEDLSTILQGGGLKNGGVFELPQRNLTFSEGVGPNSGGFFEQPESSNNFSEENSSNND